MLWNTRLVAEVYRNDLQQNKLCGSDLILLSDRKEGRWTSHSYLTIKILKQSFYDHNSLGFWLLSPEYFSNRALAQPICNLRSWSLLFWVCSSRLLIYLAQFCLPSTLISKTDRQICINHCSCRAVVRDSEILKYKSETRVKNPRSKPAYNEIQKVSGTVLTWFYFFIIL